MRATLAILFLAINFSNALAQDNYFISEDYDWDKPEYSTVELDDSTDLYYVLNKHLFNYFFNGDDFVEDYLIHKSVLLNSDDAIEGYNTIYISQGSGGIINFKARVINKDGSIVELDKSDILTGVDEETENEYTYFALEGLQIGSQVEYFYIRRFEPQIKGISITAQSYHLTEKFELDVISPWNLVFSGKAYNTDQSWEEDTTLENENRIYFHMDNVIGLDDEVSAFREANLIKTLFKLDENLYNGKKDITSYAYVAQNVVAAINLELSKKEKKALDRILKDIENSGKEEGIGEIQKIENHLKSNYSYIDVGAPELSNIESIYENKAFNDYGALKLYTKILGQKEIPYQIVYGCDRSEFPFDPDFESNVFLEDVLLYFPEEDKFLDYSSLLSRFGVVSAYYFNQHLLFIDQMDLGEEIVGVSTTEFAPAKKADFTMDSLYVKVNFSEDFFDNSLDVLHSTTGYYAMNFQPVFSLIVDEEDREEYQEQLLKYIDADAKVKDLKLTNAEANLLGVKPLIAEGRLEEANFLDKAGTNYLFKIGKLIGPQAEMYEEDSVRHMDVGTEYARTYHRVISFEVPAGYTVDGLESLNMDEKMMFKNELSARFVSKYTREGDKITVDVYEFYDEVEYPKETFEDYQRVINAAADFNKKTLILEKV